MKLINPKKNKSKNKQLRIKNNFFYTLHINTEYHYLFWEWFLKIYIMAYHPSLNLKHWKNTCLYNFLTKYKNENIHTFQKKKKYTLPNNRKYINFLPRFWIPPFISFQPPLLSIRIAIYLLTLWLSNQLIIIVAQTSL